jgi:glutaredoxin-like protein
MASISLRDQQAIREHFDANLKDDVEIVMFTEHQSPIIVPGREQCETCDDTRELLEMVSALSDKVTMTVHELSTARDEAAAYGVDRVPAFILKGAAKGLVRFFGIPAGHEFSAFIADIVDTSRGEAGLSEETREYLATLTEDVNIKVFTTPT